MVNDFENWDLLNRNEWYKTGWSGEMEWDVQWKRDPWTNTEQAVFTELIMNPKNKENAGGKIDFHFNEDRFDVEAYKPGNTVGTTSTNWSLGLDSGTVLSVGLSQTQTQSNIDVDMVGDTVQPSEDVEHAYTINGDLVWNQVKLNAAAAGAADPNPGDHFCKVNLHGSWGQYSLADLKNTYSYSWR